MKLWVSKNIKNIPEGYTQITDYKQAIEWIKRCERNISYIGEKYRELWDITEINFNSILDLANFIYWQMNHKIKYNINFRGDMYENNNCWWA